MYCCTRYPPLQDQQVLHEQGERKPPLLYNASHSKWRMMVSSKMLLVPSRGFSFCADFHLQSCFNKNWATGHVFHRKQGVKPWIMKLLRFCRITFHLHSLSCCLFSFNWMKESLISLEVQKKNLPACLLCWMQKNFAFSLVKGYCAAPFCISIFPCLLLVKSGPSLFIPTFIHAPPSFAAPPQAAASCLFLLLLLFLIPLVQKSIMSS